MKANLETLETQRAKVKDNALTNAKRAARAYVLLESLISNEVIPLVNRNDLEELKRSLVDINLTAHKTIDIVTL